ncbi:hypothetical protein CXB51_017298 [Gossypium anomalum]|uniref:Integrase catalytic domain-containing protein n=1 Tax=Gossypium anomalum TaxID=47600 RepID=A0A8J5YUH3_9ROSI|nr:hypothetical protein CXB51_017298 [Gossypium anomalum]
MRNTLYSIKKGSLTIKDYLSKVKSLSDSLTAAGSLVTEQEQISVILAGLPIEFESIQILASATSLSLELQGNLDKTGSDSNRSSNHGYRGQTRGWSRGRTRGSGREWSRSKPQCQLCGKIGHLVQTYYHRFDENFSGPDSRSSMTVNYHSLGEAPTSHCSSSHCCSSCLTPSSSHALSSSVATQTWYPNSGATNHITPTVASLNNASPYTGTSQVSMGNGESVSIDNVGSSTFTAGSRLLHLKHVLHVPAVCKNLMSVGQFARDNAVFFEFHPFLCFWKDIQTGKILLEGHMHDGLYRFDFSRPTFSKPASRFGSPLVCNIQTPSSADLWHDKLGHPYSNTLARVLNSCNVSFKRSGLQFMCTPCKLGKFHKLPFGSSQTVYSVPFELVASDVWGPSYVSSNGFSYYVSFVDMYSRYIWSYFLKSKSEVARCFLHFHKMVQVQFGASIKMLQTDGGGEYRALSATLSQLSVQHRLTCPYTSEQNGVAKKRHRHVVDMGLTLLARASMPLEYWSFAFSHAVHIINRLPTPILHHQTPYEKLYKTNPDYSQLKVFGSACFPYLRLFQQHKLQFRSQKCVFLGFGSHQKGYKCLTEDGHVFVSRDVLFDETSFPFQAGFSLPTAESPIRFHPQNSPVPVVASLNSTSSGSSTQPPVVLHSPSPLPSPQESVSLPSSSPSSAPGDVVAQPSPSPTSAPGDTVAQPPSSVNGYLMRTRSKNGIFKPKLLCSILNEKEPSTIAEAFKSPAWTTAAQAKYRALLANNTWDLVPLPDGRRAVGCKWIFKVKRHADGSVARYKGRLVVKGYLQEAGVDFLETFSPVVKPTTIRIVLPLAVSRGWSLRQVDINNAFLNGDLHEEIYMQQPPGFEQHHLDGRQLVCKLRKALYGLKQAPCAWFHKLRDFLLASQFVASKANSSLFIRQTGSQFMYVLVYVDDIIVTGPDSYGIDQYVKALDENFSLKDLGPLHYFLGIESKASPMPMVTTSRLSDHDGEPTTDEHLFRSIVGALQYVVITRPDIAFSVNKVCQYMHKPLDAHFKAVKQILRYLQGTLDYGLQFTRSSKLLLEVYSNASWGSDTDDRRSISGFCVFLGGNPISWSSRKQQVVSRSTAEAEYRNLANVTAEMILIQSLLEKVANGLLQVGHISGQEQIADILTKPLSVGLFDKFRSKLRVICLGGDDLQKQ